MPHEDKLAQSNKRLAMAGFAIHQVGFGLGIIGGMLVSVGFLDMGSGVAVLDPIGFILRGLGLVIVASIASRAGVPLKGSVNSSGHRQ